MHISINYKFSKTDFFGFYYGLKTEQIFINCKLDWLACEVTFFFILLSISCSYFRIVLTIMYSSILIASSMSFQTKLQNTTKLKKILQESKETVVESDLRSRMQPLKDQLASTISHLHSVFETHVFIAICRGYWDRMGQVSSLSSGFCCLAFEHLFDFRQILIASYFVIFLI